MKANRPYVSPYRLAAPVDRADDGFSDHDESDGDNE